MKISDVKFYFASSLEFMALIALYLGALTGRT